MGAAPFRRGAGAWLLAVLPLLAAPCRAQTGTVSAMPVQGLRFGLLGGGAPSVVSPLDAGRRATLELIGVGHVTITFELPAGLVARSGATLPLQFRPDDGRIAFPGAGQELVFDPAAPVSFVLQPAVGSASLFLGGAAHPSAQQAPGEYTATITVYVVVANTAT